jgi:hypothetical protein
MRKVLIFLFLLKVSGTCFGQCNDVEINSLKKIAIIFGEKNYLYANALVNPLNDAADMSQALKNLGFLVYTYEDADLRTMGTAINSWYSLLPNYDVALFYYSGHGAEINGVNYIFPIDANPTSSAELQYDCYPVNEVLDNVTNAKVKINIIILDACRNNPFAKSWNVNRDFSSTVGLAPMNQNGCFIGYAAAPGTVASDGSGRNGTYTNAILDNIKTPNLTIDEIFTRVNSEVQQITNGNQVPFKNSSLPVDYCFSAVQSREFSLIGNSQKQIDDSVFGNTIKSLLFKVPFNSTINDVITYEFGASHSNDISYDSLPIAMECTGQSLHYYWRYLNQSKMGKSIDSFLVTKHLRNKVSKDSYVIYGFKDNKLARVNLRLFSVSNDFKGKLFESLDQDTVNYPNKYQVKLLDNYFISSSSENGTPIVEIYICNETGYKLCESDWWHNVTLPSF